MYLLLLATQGITVRCESRRVYAEKDEEVLFEIQTRQVSSVAVMGNVQVTTQALALFAEIGVPVTFLTIEGKLKGEFFPMSNKNLYLRYAQYRTSLDDEFVFEMAKQVVLKKLQSYTGFYRSVQKNKPLENIGSLLKTFANLSDEAAESRTCDELLGYEGAAARLHFSEYGSLFTGELQFSGRSYRPPRDEVNAMLSFGYTMLGKLLNGLLHSSGLDIYLGCLHRERYNRPSLTCDFIEVFRVGVVDRLVLTLCNKGIMKAKHFEITDEGIRFTNIALKAFLSHWKQLSFYAPDNQILKEIEREISWYIKSVKEAAARYPGMKNFQQAS